MKRFVGWSLGIAALLACPVADAALRTRTMEYKQGTTVLTGYVAWDDAKPGKRPAVLVVHEWWGHNAHARRQAERLAQAGYVGFALDMFGKGKLAQHPKDAQAFVAEATASFPAERARFEAALAEAKRLPEVDASRIAAFGYCFGGAVALDMARAGVPLAAVVTFHGSLGTQLPPPPTLTPRILVQTGADDPMIGAEAIESFKKAMTQSHATFQVISYPGAKHSFTNPEADKAGIPALAYNKAVDDKSFAAALAWLGEAFAPPAPKAPPSKSN